MNCRSIALLTCAVLAASCGSATSLRQPTPTMPASANATTNATPAATQSAPTTTPGVHPGDLSWASSAVGPVVVYRDGSGVVVAYDVGAGRELRRASSTFAMGVESSSVWRYWVDVPLYQATLRPAGAAAEPIGDGAGPMAAIRAYSLDGRLAAFVEHDGNSYDGPSVIKVVDVSSGAERLSLPFKNPYSDAHPGFRGVPAVVTWRDDDAGFFIIGTYPIDVATGYATVMLDGSVRVHELGPGDSIAPSGRAAALIDVWSMSCDYHIDSHRIRVRDLDTDLDSNVVVDSGRMLVPVEWSPSGDELLYASYEVGPARADPSCAGERDPSTARWFLLPAAGGEPVPVADPHRVREQWYGARLVDITCVDRSSPSWNGNCSSGRARTVNVGGKEIVTGEGIIVLGFVDAPPAR